MHKGPSRFLVGAVLAVCGLIAQAGLYAAAVDVDKLPQPTGYVSDLAGVVDPAQKQQLEDFCTRVEGELGVQFALVTIDSVSDRPIRDVALDLSRKWGVGAKKDNQGVLLLLAIKDHKSDIETGRGIEPYLTDGFSGNILRAVRPDLQSSNYGQALNTAAHRMAAQIAQGKGIAFSDTSLPPLPEDTPRSARSHGSGIPFPLIVLGIFFLLWLFSRGGGRRGGGYRGGGGFLTGMLLGNLLGGGRGYGGGNWGGGGGFGGGSSGGGGGFGGFGGGDFGGGGASSDW
ncbi:MAG: TPM domain-containing protein [Acidobacteriota bacterium]|nr:TPM domain-containing protein [Acidobacteriota bacterium]